MKLIDKDAVLAIIEKELSYYKDLEDRGILSEAGIAAYRVIRLLKSDIDSLEVKDVDTEQLNKLLNWWKEVTSDYSAYKVKGVDLEKEMSEYFVEHPDEFFSDKYKLFAKHFFELGLKAAQKGE